MKEQLPDEENQIEHLRKQMQCKDVEINDLKGYNKATKDKYLTRAYETQKDIVIILTTEMTKRDNEIDKLKTEIHDLSSRLSCMNEQLRDEDSQMENLREKIQSKDVTIYHLKQQHENNEGRLKALEEDNKEYATKYKALTSAYEDERTKGKRLAAKMTKEIRNKDKEIHKLKTENNDLSSGLLKEVYGASFSESLKAGHVVFVEPKCEKAKQRYDNRAFFQKFNEDIAKMFK